MAVKTVIRPVPLRTDEPASYALYQESMMARWNMGDRAFHAFGFHYF